MAIITRCRMPPEKLVRILVHPRGRVGDADFRQHLDGVRARRRLVLRGPLVLRG